MTNLGKIFFKKENILIGGAIFVVLATVLGLAIGIPLSQSKTSSLSKANTLLENNVLIDGHNDLPQLVRGSLQNQFARFDFNDMKLIINGTTHTDLKRLKEGKLGAQFWVAYAGCQSLAKDAARLHLEQIDMIKRLVMKYPDYLEFVTSSAGIKTAFKNKKIASLVGVESGHAIDSSLALLRIFYEVGARYMTLTHNCNVPWATYHEVDKDPANAAKLGGLSKFGRKVIQEMNRLGMMVDLSHTSYRTQLDALDESKAPVIFSHSSVTAVCNITRNTRDDVLVKLKKNRGIIMVNFYNGFVTCQDTATVDDVVKHFEHIKQIIGVDNIGIGADYDGVPRTPEGLEDVSAYPNLFAKLLDNGWSEEDLIKVAGGNLIRVFEEVEKYSENVRSHQPIDDFISQDDLSEDSKKCRTSF